MIGLVIGNYVIVSELGKGGMGMVYRAEHTKITRTVALKILLPQHSADPDTVQRFFTEARAASSIDHPGIVEIYDFGVHTDGRAYLVMELLTGQSLGHLLAQGALPPLDAGAIVGQVVSVIAAAHARGIVHRDLKPDHIVLEPSEIVPGAVQVKLLDFGIAKMIYEQGGAAKTQTGAMIGTPTYMSPEQCMGKSDLDHRTDLYAIGCILFHALCGRVPFTSEHGTGMLIAAHLRDAPPDPRVVDPRIPPALAAITLRLLEKDPAARFQSALELRAALVSAGVNIATTLQRPATPSIPPRMPLPPVIAAAPDQPTIRPAASAGVSKRTVAIIGGLAFLAASTCVFAIVSYATRKDAPAEAPPTVAAAPKPAPAPAPAPPVAPPVATRPPAATPAATPPPPAVVAEAACVDGQARTDDTRGHCCWSGQAWSSAKDKCVGASACPAGFRADGEACVAAKTSTTAIPPTAPDAAVAPALSLGARTYAPGAKVIVTFAQPISSTEASKAFVTIANTENPPSSFESREFLPDRAQRVTLTVPTERGDYEVRLFTNSPKENFKLARVVGFSVRAAESSAAAPPVVAETPKAPPVVVAAPPPAQPAKVVASDETPRAQQRFSAPGNAPAGSRLAVRFPVALHALKGEQFWVTVVTAGSAPGSWGRFEYLEQDVKGASLVLPTEPGAYELRLHANYPTKPNNIVFRAPLRIDPN